MLAPAVQSQTAISLHVVPGLGEVREGDDLAQLLGDALEGSGLGLQTGDILTVAHKVVSKAEGRVRKLADVSPGPEAQFYAEKLSKDARKVQVVLDETTDVLRAFKHRGAEEGTLICEHRLGLISANAGVDESNTAQTGEAILLPENPDASAATLAEGLSARFGAVVGVVITDTFGRPWRLGQVNVAIGLAGVPATRSEIGGHDARGRPLKVTEPAFADELAAASGLLVGKAAQTPAVLFRGLAWDADTHTSGRHLIRAKAEDMFR
ncbi:MAG: coenzyme F420-0:L-glutamate ligase [Devosiaceae bacterium]|nr:coenzyme F420-0:L-glutamate ligase [Devosiaceae bacterium MH13]